MLMCISSIIDTALEASKWGEGTKLLIEDDQMSNGRDVYGCACVWACMCIL